jgi:hypothetical protein
LVSREGVSAPGVGSAGAGVGAAAELGADWVQSTAAGALVGAGTVWAELVVITRGVEDVIFI